MGNDKKSYIVLEKGRVSDETTPLLHDRMVKLALVEDDEPFLQIRVKSEIESGRCSITNRHFTQTYEYAIVEVLAGRKIQ